MPAKSQTETNMEIKADMRVSLDIQLKDTVNGTENVLTLSSIVEELLEDGTILIHMPMHQGYHYSLPENESLLMKFFIDSEMYALQARFEERVMQGDFVLAKMRQLSKIKPHQQRDCFRFPCSLPVTIEYFWRDEMEKHPKRQPAEGLIIDFSDGGVRFGTDENIEKGEIITLTFDIGETGVVEGIALRTERAEGGKYLFKVAVRFRTADKNQKRRFYKYIVDKQQEERRRQIYNNKFLY